MESEIKPSFSNLLKCITVYEKVKFILYIN